MFKRSPLNLCQVRLYGLPGADTIALWLNLPDGEMFCIAQNCSKPHHRHAKHC
ncbi:MAG: hypothetical protein RBJ76_03850 [Stenomitos frigidus ULC029]